MRLFSFKITNRTSHFQNINSWEGGMHSGFNKDEMGGFGSATKGVRERIVMNSGETV